MPLWPVLLMLIAAGTWAPCLATEPLPVRLFDLKTRQEAPLPDRVSELARQRVILVGEHHTVAAHHHGQLAVIRALQNAGVPLAIGMEMLRQDSQTQLERWVGGTLGEDEMRRVWAENWGYDWSLYADILEFARHHKLPLVGLNVSREITRQVARNGFASLSAEQRGDLHHITCRVDADYMRFIREAFGGHAHGQMNFEFFCEAQLVWDSVMAIHARDWLTAHPERVMVLLAGTGHAHKLGIPARLAQYAPQLAVTAILPEVAGVIDARQLDDADADYLLRIP